jgi:hypothetical protein
MNVVMGNQFFGQVTVPLLWGTRAVIQDGEGRLSIIDLSGETASAEVVGDQPALGVAFLPKAEGFAILQDRKALYTYLPAAKRLVPGTLRLPECEINSDGIRIGSNFFSGNTVIGFGVGIAVSESGISMGGPLPPQLARLVTP